VQQAKRTFDLIASAAGLLVTWPVLTAAALAIRLRLGKPVLFRQTRPGLHGRPFTLYKFRTMTNDCGSDGRPLPNTQRLGSLGRFLRSTSLDELPSLWNVVKGDMSLVGPRPLLMEYLCHYTFEQARRLTVRPGVTGWAQVNGRNAATWDDRFALDNYYVDHQSLWFDLRILWLTALSVLRREGVNPEGDATPPFMALKASPKPGSCTATEPGEGAGTHE